MITEDYVSSFEVAKLLEEKGFNNDYPKGDCTQYPCTLQMAMKWLRKKYQIFIRPDINFLYPIRYYCEIFCYGDNLKTQPDVRTEDFESLGEACEAAIKYCLENLI